MPSSPTSEDTLILNNSAYQAFKTQSSSTLKTAIFDGQTKPPISNYEEKISRLIHQLTSKKEIDKRIENVVVLDYGENDLYEKLINEFYEKYSINTTAGAIDTYLNDLNPDLYVWNKTNQYSLPSYETNVSNQIVLTQDKVRSFIEGIEKSYLEFEFIKDGSQNLIKDSCGNFIERPIRISILEIVKMELARLYIFNEFSNIKTILTTHYWNKIAIQFLHQIYNLSVQTFNSSQQSEYLTLRNRMNYFVDFMDEVTYLYKTSMIDIDNLIYLIFLNYRANEKNSKEKYYHFNKDYYVQKLIADFGFYQPMLYLELQLDEPRILEKFKLKLQDLFVQLSPYIQPIYKAETLIEQYISEKGFTGSYSTYDTILDIDVSYSLIIKNLKTKNLIHLKNFKSSIDTAELIQMSGYNDIFLEIRTFLSYDNFELINYFDNLFLGNSLHPIHKFVLSLKALMFTSYSQTFYDYLKDHRQKLNGTKNAIGTRTDTGVLVTDIFPDELLQQLITHNLDLLFYSRLFTLCEMNPFRYVDAIFYYYAYTHGNVINKTAVIQIIDDETNLNMNNSMYLIDDVAKNFPNHIVDGMFSKYTQNVVSVSEYLIHPDQDYENFLISDIFKMGPTGPSIDSTGGTQSVLDLIRTSERAINKLGGTFSNIADDLSSFIQSSGVTGATQSALDLIRSYQAKDKFDSINMDSESFDHRVITHNYITKSMKLIYCLLKTPTVTDSSLNSVFSTEICNYIYTRKLNTNLYNQIYTLFTVNEIDNVALSLFLLHYSYTENKVAKPIVGKYISSDRIKDIRLNNQTYIKNLKTYLTSVHSSLASWMETNLVEMEEMLRKSYFSTAFHNQIDTTKLLDKHNTNVIIQSVSEANYSYLVDQIVLEEIQTPEDLKTILESVYFAGDTVRFLIRDTLKNNYSRFLNISFYVDWIKSYIATENGLTSTVLYSTMGYLLSRKIMTEDDLYKVSIEFDSITSTLIYKNITQYYTIQQSPVEIGEKYNPPSSPMNRSSMKESVKSNKPENIFDLLKSMDLNNIKLPSADNMKKLSSETPIVDIKKTMDEINDEINQDKKNSPDTLNGQGENPDQKAKTLFENNKMVDLYKHLKKLGETRPELNESLKYNEEKTNGVVMAWQIIVSLFDPSQVLSDMLCEKMIRAGVLRDTIDRWKTGSYKDKFKMDISNYPSFLYAWVLATAALIPQGYNPWIQLGAIFALGIAVAMTFISLMMAPVGLAAASVIVMAGFAALTYPSDEQLDLAKSYIEGQDIDEASVNSNAINFRLGPYIFVNMFKKIFNLKDPIRAAKKAEIGITSSIAKINYEVGKMVVQKGGDGLVKIQKN